MSVRSAAADCTPSRCVCCHVCSPNVDARMQGSAVWGKYRDVEEAYLGSLDVYCVVDVLKWSHA